MQVTQELMLELIKDGGNQILECSLVRLLSTGGHCYSYFQWLPNAQRIQAKLVKLADKDSWNFN